MLNINMLTRVVQWAVYEDARAGAADAPRWNQGTWGEGHALDQIVVPETNETHHSDNQWVPVKCDSGCCLAGNTTLLNGDTFIIPEREKPNVNDDYAVEVQHVLTADSKEVRIISERAEELLGLMSWEADHLFGGSNDIYEVVAYSDVISQSHGHDPLDLIAADKVRESMEYSTACDEMLDYIRNR